MINKLFIYYATKPYCFRCISDRGKAINNNLVGYVLFPWFTETFV